MVTTLSGIANLSWKGRPSATFFSVRPFFLLAAVPRRCCACSLSWEWRLWRRLSTSGTRGATCYQQWRRWVLIGLQEYAHYSSCSSFQLWELEQKLLLEQLRGRTLCLAGDGRADSPGHSADFGAYTLLETTINKVVHLEVVKVPYIGYVGIKGHLYFAITSICCVKSTGMELQCKSNVPHCLSCECLALA